MSSDNIPEELLHGIGNDVVSAMSLMLGRHFVTGDLLNSIQYHLEGDEIVITAAKHWKYVEYGTAGTKTGRSSSVGGDTVVLPPNPNRKMPVYKRGDKFFNFITNKEDYALAKHVQLYGTTPYPFVRPVLYHQLDAIIMKNFARYARGPT